MNDYKKWVDETFSKVTDKLLKVSERSYDKLPYSAKDGVHDDYKEGAVSWWTNGFWGGMMWLMYKGTGNEQFKKTAIHSEELLNKALENFESLHHDVGFMWHLTTGADYKITGNKKAYNVNLYAAATLASRFNADGQFIRAWNDKGTEGWTIIDCLMNIPLLYWASDVTGDDRFKRIAIKHADMALRDHIRKDASVNHIVEHDVDTGKVIKVHRGQGYSDTSCWTRGEAWAVYGMILSYIHTKKEEYLDAAIKCADYFMENCKKTDYLCPVDFNQPEKPLYYDSTAGVCTVCGLIEISKYAKDKEKYLDAAIKILKATDENFCNYDQNIDYIVGKGTERYPFTENDMKGVHIPIIYGDFFFVEALLKLKGDDFLIW